MIILINGAPGSGKTKTAQYVFEHTPHCAWIDGDVMLAIHPQKRTEQELDLREQNIATVAKNYHEHGYKTVFISFVYMGPVYLAKQIDLLKHIDEVKVVALIPDEETLRNRHANDDYKREGIESSIDINNKIKSLKADEVINNSQMTVEEVGMHIMRKVLST